MVQITIFATVLAVSAVGVLAKTKAVTTDIFLVGFDSQKLVGSVIASDSSATTFAVACSDPKAKGCQLPTDFIFTQGPSTMHYKYSHQPTASDDPARTVEVGCVITASDHGECSKSLEATLGTITSTAASATTTFTAGGSELGGGQAVTITAGNLVTPSSTVSSTTTSSKSSSTTVVQTPTSTPVNDDSFAKPTSTTQDKQFFEATKSIAIGTSTSKAGAMPMITGNARYVIGGAAAAIALAAL